MKKNHYIPVGEVAEVTLRYESKGPRPSDRKKITGSKDSYEVLRPFFDAEGIEHHEAMFIVGLNRANKVIAVAKIGQGGIAGTVADPKFMFQFALLTNSSGIIIAHNHPSGSPKASQSDIDLTRKVKEGGRAMEIQLLDHMILTPEGQYFSFADEGLI